MTTYPDPPLSTDLLQTRDARGAPLHPQITDEFWGYEVRMTAQSMTLATVLRGLAGLGGFVAVLMAAGLWVRFVTGATPASLGATLLGTLALLAVAVGGLHGARRGSQMRVQVDTSTGELREVVDAGSGGVVILARYGFDAVTAVELVESRHRAGYGQIHVLLAGSTRIAVADGALTALRGLRTRLAHDLGVETTAGRVAEWTGPLAA